MFPFNYLLHNTYATSTEANQMTAIHIHWLLLLWMCIRFPEDTLNWMPCYTHHKY